MEVVGFVAIRDRFTPGLAKGDQVFHNGQFRNRLRKNFRDRVPRPEPEGYRALVFDEGRE